MTEKSNARWRSAELASLPKRVVVTDKEKEILQFVNEFGFCDIGHVMRRFGIGRSRCYSHMQLLIRLGLIIHSRIRQNEPGVYCLTHKGGQLIVSDLPQQGKIPLPIYHHQLTVIDVYLKLREHYPEASWTTERRLLQEKFTTGFGKKDHLPDGVLVLPADSHIAVEVEISNKRKSKLEDIVMGYALQVTYKEVWYFCSPWVISAVRSVSSNMPFVKVYSLPEFLA